MKSIRMLLIVLSLMQSAYAAAPAVPKSEMRKFFEKLKKIVTLSDRILKHVASNQRESAKHILLLLNDLADLGLLFVDMGEKKKIKVSDTSVDFEKLSKRIDCLLSKNDAALKKEFAASQQPTSEQKFTSSSDGAVTCPIVGCTSVINCYLLLFRDLVYATQLVMEDLVGKLNQTEGLGGKKATTLEPGLVIEAFDVTLPFFKFFADKITSPSMRPVVDTTIAKLEGNPKEPGTGVKGAAMGIQQALAFLPESIDLAVVGIGDENIDQYLDLPTIKKDMITDSLAEEGFGEFDDPEAFAEEVRKDIEGFSDLEFV